MAQTSSAVDTNPTLVSTNSPTDGENPYFFNNNDVTGISLVSNVLKGRENFITWKRSMEIALSARSKLRFVQGFYSRPDDLAGSIKWQRCNDMLMSWIHSSVSKQILTQIIMAQDVTMAWKILTSRYSGSNLTRKYGLRQTIYNLKQGDADIAAYYEKLSGFWHELDATLGAHHYNLLSECQECKATAKDKQEERTMQFLMGLNECHDHIRTHILALPELPSMDVVYDRVSQDEAKQIIIRAPAHDSSAMNARQQQSDDFFKNSKHPSTQKGKQRLMCTHCNIPGHTKEFCFKIHGYPPWHKLYKGSGKVND